MLLSVNLCKNFTGKMARYTKEIQKQKILYAKDLYIKGYDIETIAEMLALSVTTLKAWAKKEDFESAKQSAFIGLSELRNTVLQSFVDLKDGKKPKIKPDEAAKYAAAFEKLSDKRKQLSYMYENFETLTAEFMQDIQNAKTKAEKEKALEILKIVRVKTDKVLTRTTSEVLNND